ncbi:hypothetical protein SSP24_06380 [Streptomyces spinoverrucosus]|uniref:Uncharacterized protein n=1 Tax=Streptomyces spinoverrucosus TaxID=284043 RepID=A0A4Y3V9G2_9ACTN|nr:hypothetical protein [Streptomyces spinoverrucosus]GEC02983.1 hypothetical protein SSP24_06380 [Streptomyces spinoverrucosus]GHB39094.1 hypothetical protein GCM10010397_06210 [Streptomyces spinoverrucosus]
MRAVDPHAEAHRLRAELGYGARRIARELGITRYAAEQLLDRPLPQPVAEAADEVADIVRPAAEPPRPVADRVAGHLAALVGDGPAGGRRLVIDLDQFPGLAEDLALLEHTRATAEEIVNFAVDRLAGVYRRARASGLLRDGQSFDVVDMRLRPGSLRRAA